MIDQSFRTKYPLPAKQPRSQSAIDRADDLIDIRDVIKQMNKTGEYNVWVPSGSFNSYKIFCPWAYEHADGGLDKNCRIYGTNNIYCFAMHGRITTSGLYARWKGLPRMRAAQSLLEEHGLLNRSWREWWYELVRFREDKYDKRLGNQIDVINALHVMLEQDEDYNRAEFDAPVREAWKAVLTALDQLWELPETNLEILQTWFDRSLRKILDSAKLGGNHE